MDNRTLNSDKLLVLRRKAVECVINKGYRQSDVVRMLGISANTVSKYIREYKAQGEASLSYLPRGRPQNSGSKLILSTQAEIERAILDNTPDLLGLECVLWTREAVSHYIEKKYGINYSKWTVGRLLKKWGFSPQKPIKRAFERNPAKVKAWLEEDYPMIKARSQKENADIFWGDEMGIRSEDHRGRTYGKIGKTPVISKTGRRFGCNMIAAITNSGLMKWMVFCENFTTQKFIEFLKRLIYKAHKKIFLILDNHSVHHAKKVKEWLRKYEDKIELFFLPPYCPEMNPQELVNQDVKANAGNFRLMRTLDDLLINVRYYLTKVQFNQFKIMGYFKKEEVYYAS